MSRCRSCLACASRTLGSNGSASWWGLRPDRVPGPDLVDRFQCGPGVDRGVRRPRWLPDLRRHTDGARFAPAAKILIAYQDRVERILPADGEKWRLSHRLLHLTPFGLTALTIALLDPFSIPDAGSPLISGMPYAFVAVLVAPFNRQAAAIRSRIVFTERGSAVVLAFLGAKLPLLALQANTVPFMNSGEPVHWAPDLPASILLGVMTGIVWITILTSLIHERRQSA